MTLDRTMKKIEKDEHYEALRKKGISKEKAARMAYSDKIESEMQDEDQLNYEDWTKGNLLNKAREVGIEGCSDMDKYELIEALRDN